MGKKELALAYRCLIGLLASLLCIIPGLAASPGNKKFAEIDTFIESKMAKDHIPGVSLVVAQGDEIVYRQGYGIAGTDRPMTTDTPMFIGSQTKSFTALAVMQLVDSGKIELSAPVQRYIPWFKVSDPQASAQITVRSLLNHSSGLSESGYIPNLPDIATMEDVVRDLQRARPTAVLGEKFQYFNSGYIVLGYLIEIVSGQNYGDYLEQHIFKPLGMIHSSAIVDQFASMDVAQGYTQLFGFPIPMDQPVASFYLPAGFIVSTADDLARYLIAIENGGELDGKRILSEKSVALMLTPNTTNGSIAGLGWDITSYYGEKEIIHGGANERFNTQVLILPESGLSVVMLINQDHMFKATYDYPPLFWGVISQLTGRPIPKQHMSGVVIGYVLLAAFVAILFFSVRGVLALFKEREKMARLTAGRRWLRLLQHGISIVVTLVVVMVIGPSLAGRGFDLRWFIGFYPDVAIMAGFILAVEIAQGLVKAIYIFRPINT